MKARIGYALINVEKNRLINHPGTMPVFWKKRIAKEHWAVLDGLAEVQRVKITAAPLKKSKKK